MIVDEERIKRIARTIVSAISPEKIVLFGSLAYGSPDNSSDVDLLIIWDAPLNQHEKNVRIRRLFPTRDFALDILTFSSSEAAGLLEVKGSLVHTAMTKGITLYERQAA
jgi:uncharacterized protein